jgi:hypothetical protein
MRALSLLALVAALAVPVEASHCSMWETARPEVDVLGLYYVDHDHCHPDCIDNVWVYEESNGIPGLQRGDEWYDNTCHGMIPSDTIVF